MGQSLHDEAIAESFAFARKINRDRRQQEIGRD